MANPTSNDSARRTAHGTCASGPRNYQHGRCELLYFETEFNGMDEVVGSKKLNTENAVEQVPQFSSPS